MVLTVSPSEDRIRLDELLARRLPGLSRMYLRQLVETGRVSVEGEHQAPGWRVRAGDRVSVDADLERATAMTPEPIPLSVLHEDADLIVVDKPAGMVAHPAGRHRGGTLVNALAYHFNVAGAADPPVRPGIVHRLDRATSGLMVVAKNQRALSRLTIAFQNRRVEKGYLALVHGRVEPDEGIWEAPIGSDPDAVPKWGVRETGRPARTRFRIREYLPRHTLLELEPITGRTNQLRLHCAHFGHPIAGDELFGRGPDPELGRLFLHAFRLGFPHPATGEWTVFESPLPPALTSHLDRHRRDPESPD